MSNDHKVRLAINLADLTDKVNEKLRRDVINLINVDEPFYTVPGEIEDVAVGFNCSLLGSASVIDAVRSHDRKVKDRPTRAYIFRESWTKLPSDAVLSIIVANKPCLNPIIFPRSVGVARQVAPPVRRFVPGQKGGE